MRRRGSVSPGTSGSSKARSTRHRASTSRIPARNRLPSPSPVDEPGTSPAMSTTSMPARTTFWLALMRARASSRASGSGATATAVSVVVKGCDATGASAPVRALNNDVLPALGKPTRPSRSIGSRRYRLADDAPSGVAIGASRARAALPSAVTERCRRPIAWTAMSKRTVKRKIRSKKKANHGKRPNAGRG